MKRIWKYGWVNRKSKHHPDRKFHRISTHMRFHCGTAIFSASYDSKYKEIPQEAIDNGREIFCKRCFPDLIIYPDMSLPDELFSI
jgi:hypothetical protein